MKRSLKLTCPFEEYLDAKFKCYEGFILNDSEKADIINTIKRHFKDWAVSSIKRGDDICEHNFLILGNKRNLGENIDWHKDYFSGGKWPVEYHKRIKIINFTNESDIKYVWEVNRFHHAIYLGKAYALTRDERYAEEFFTQYHKWLEANPPYRSVNWTCAMEVAIRAVNLIWAMLFFKDSKFFDYGMKESFLRSMFFHGKYIYDNLEINMRIINGKCQTVNSNHYIANLVGLAYISLLFPEFKESTNWFSKSYSGLINEIRLQVLDDGVHHELSLNYHRLVLEMILSALIFLKKRNISIPSDVWAKVEKMVEFILYYTKPDGSVPLVRDIDNGRLHILGEYQLDRHQHILAIAAILFQRHDFARSGFSEDALWLLGDEGYKTFTTLESKGLALESKGFHKSGFYIMRKSDLYMFAICSPVGMQGYCGHTHNDFLSFDLFAYDKTFLTDSGSYVYSRYPKWRNKFRSTYSHNTVVIDGHEINCINEKELFYIGSDVNPTVNLWQSDSEKDLLDAEYSINLETGVSVTHRRKFYFDKKRNYWVIKDMFRGKGQHKLETMFHFNKYINVAIENNIYLKTICENEANLIIIPLCKNNISLSLLNGEVSSVYGLKDSTQVACYFYEGDLPVEQAYLLLPLSHFFGENDTSYKWKSCQDFINIIPGLEGIATTL